MLLPPEEDRFKKNAEGLSVCILDEVQNMFEKGYKVLNPGLVYFASEYIKTIDANELINGFIINSHMHWDKIKDREESFFIHHASTIFEKLPKETVTLFKDLYETKDQNNQSIISNNFKTKMWEYFDALVKISIKYTYKHKHLYNDINITYHTNNWQIKVN